MQKIKDIKGLRFGSLVAKGCIGVREIGDSRKRAAFWNCLCDCGNHFITSGVQLRSGKTVRCDKCGPLGASSEVEDITGKSFGRLTAIERIPLPESSRRWKVSRRWSFKCLCGKTEELSIGQVTGGDPRTQCSKCTHRTLPPESKYSAALEYKGEVNEKPIFLFRCKACDEQFLNTRRAKGCGCLLKTKKKQRDKVKVVRAKLFLLNYLKNHPCVDCGFSNPMALEFDHVRGSKSFELGAKAYKKSISSIEQEIEKCDVRCANCHRIRHSTENKNFKTWSEGEVVKKQSYVSDNTRPFPVDWLDQMIEARY